MSDNQPLNNSANNSEQASNIESKEKAWLLYLQGKTQFEVSKELGVSQGTISNWLKEIRNEGKERIKDLPII